MIKNFESFGDSMYPIDDIYNWWTGIKVSEK